MSHPKLILLILLITIVRSTSHAQVDSVLISLRELPSKYFSETQKKIDKYSGRLTSKTEKTLTKLARWENKIRTTLHKTNPEVEQKLFANPDLSFAGMLEKLKQSQKVLTNYTSQYDDYRSKLNTSFQYLAQQKEVLDSNFIRPARVTVQKMQKLEDDISQTEAAEKLIRERKKQLINEAIKYMGKSKYLKRINKESYYYVETLKNYKETFSDPSKVENLAKKILSKTPFFKDFVQKNSFLGALFPSGTSNSNGDPQSLLGLQNRSSINNLLQERLISGGPNAQGMFQQNMQAAQTELNKLKRKIGSSSETAEGDLPGFKPNNQKTKTFRQRLEFGVDFQTKKGNSFIPGSVNMGSTLGYKMNDKSVIGFGASYIIGMGNIQKIKITSQGFSARSFLDWKLKKNLFMTGGYEINRIKVTESFTGITTRYHKWQQSGLIGISKKYKIGKRGNAKTQLLWDFLSYSQKPVSQPLIFRIGIPLK